MSGTANNSMSGTANKRVRANDEEKDGEVIRIEVNFDEQYKYNDGDANEGEHPQREETKRWIEFKQGEFRTFLIVNDNMTSTHGAATCLGISSWDPASMSNVDLYSDEWQCFHISRQVLWIKRNDVTCRRHTASTCIDIDLSDGEVRGVKSLVDLRHALSKVTFCVYNPGDM